MQIRNLTSWLVGMTLLVAVAAPVAAQSPSSSSSPAAAGSEVGVEVNELHFGGFGGVGFDGNYWTNPLTDAKSSLGIRLAIVAEAGYHHFSGDSVVSAAGGVHFSAEKFASAKFQPYANVMFGIGRFSAESETDKILVLMPGIDIPLQNKSFKIRAEIGQVWDFFDGGHEVAWRYSIGVALPLK